MRSSIIQYGQNVSNIEAARAALNYNVSKEEIFDADGNSLADFRGMFNSETRQILGVVKKGFTFIQPSESLEIMEAAVKATGARWTSVASVRGGASLYAFAELPAEKQIRAPKRGDLVSMGFGIRDAFDGSALISGSVFANVLACTNGAKSKRNLFAFAKKHTASLSEVIEGIRYKFAVAVDEAVEEMRATVTQLDNTPMTKSEHDAFTLRLFGVRDEVALTDGSTPTRTLNRVNEVRSLFVRGMGNVGRTRWDSFNAVTEYLDWYSTFRETNVSFEENRFLSITDGNAARVREQALELLLN